MSFGLFQSTSTVSVSLPSSADSIYIFKDSKIWHCTIGSALPFDSKCPSFVVDDSKSVVRLFADSSTCPDRNYLSWNNASGQTINLERSESARQRVFYSKNEVPRNGCLDVWEWTPGSGLQNFSSQNQFTSLPTMQLDYASSQPQILPGLPQITN